MFLTSTVAMYMFFVVTVFHVVTQSGMLPWCPPGCFPPTPTPGLQALDQDTYMAPEDAIAFGLADRICAPPPRKTKKPAKLAAKHS